MTRNIYRARYLQTTDKLTALSFTEPVSSTTFQIAFTSSGCVTSGLTCRTEHKLKKNLVFISRKTAPKLQWKEAGKNQDVVLWEQRVDAGVCQKRVGKRKWKDNSVDVGRQRTKGGNKKSLRNRKRGQESKEWKKQERGEQREQHGG